MNTLPSPPRPDLVRTPQGPFGWLEDRLLREGWLARLGPEATMVLVLLALAADRRGASFYSRERMATALGVGLAAIDLGLRRLRELGMVDHRPWRPDARDGVWQLLPLPASTQRRLGRPVSIATLLRALGFEPPADPQITADPR